MINNNIIYYLLPVKYHFQTKYLKIGRENLIYIIINKEIFKNKIVIFIFI